MKITKRDNTVVSFNLNKIIKAILKAMDECGSVNDKLAKKIAIEISEEVPELVTVETIQDMVEDKLIKYEQTKVAKAYILYRNERAKERSKGWLNTSLSRDIWAGKYQYNGETFDQFLDRISGNDPELRKILRDKKFSFGGRILANRGVDKNVCLSNCFVLPEPNDNIESIFETAKEMARTYSYGGGVGISLSKLRPRGSKVNNAARTTTGSVSFMDLYSMVTGIIGQSGRRGALMLSLKVNHPDIEEFIDVKTDLNKVTTANISVMVDNAFMEAVINNEDYTLSFNVEDTGEVIEKKVNAKKLFLKLADNNRRFAEPGMLFWDTVQNWNLTEGYEEYKIVGTNPCAEQPLAEYNSCLLGSINLSEFVVNPFTDEAEFDFAHFTEVVHIVTRGMNRVLDENITMLPLKQQQEAARDFRQIGMGVMGIADMFIKLGVAYGDKQSLEISDKIAKTLLHESMRASALLAKEQGAFPKFDYAKLAKSRFFQENVDQEIKDLIKEHGMRNCSLLSIAPTGTLSTMFGISGGIEPIFMNSYVRRTQFQDGDTFYKVYTPIVEEYMNAKGITREEDLPEFFVTSEQIKPRNRVKMQATWQKYIDTAISSTVNLPEGTSTETVANIYLDAWRHNLKGITVYVNNCERSGVLITEDAANKEIEETQVELVVEEPTQDGKYSTVCPECGEPSNAVTGGCSVCLNCGYSKCN